VRANINLLALPTPITAILILVRYKVEEQINEMIESKKQLAEKP
jgi:hypothetical protein